MSKPRLSEIEALHDAVIRGDRQAEMVRLTAEHDAIPALTAAIRAVLEVLDDGHEIELYGGPWGEVSALSVREALAAHLDLT